MRGISDWECILLAGLANYPELAYMYNDLNQIHFSSDYPFAIYQQIKTSDPEELAKYGIKKGLIDLKQKQAITQEEFNFALNDFDLLQVHFTSNDVEKAYQEIKNKHNKAMFLSEVNKINFQENELFEITTSLTEIIGKYENLDSNTYELEKLSDVGKRSHLVKPTGIKFGISKLDRTVKIEKNTFTIIAARPFNGKTTFACKVAMENSVNKTVLFITSEMTKEQIYRKIKAYGEFYKKENILIAYKPSIDMKTLARTIKKTSPDLVIIDQLNKIKSKEFKEYDRFTAVARSLKVMTGELEIPIICLAQINRSSENKRPYLYQLKGSGSLEEEPDVVIMLHVADEKREDNITKLYIDKNRTCLEKTGMIKTIFTPENNFYRGAD